MKIVKSIGLLLTSIVLLYFSWPPYQFGPMIFVALVPLLFYLDSIRDNKTWIRFLLSFVGLFAAIYTFGYWASMDAWGEYGDNVRDGVFISVFPKAFLLSFIAFIRIRKLSFLFLILAWGSVEVLQTHYEFNAPLLMIGNSLSNWPSLIQQYSIWGVMGGTMNIIAINVILFYLIKSLRTTKAKKRLLVTLGILFLPTLISIGTYFRSIDSKTVKIAIAVGHFDHFKTEFSENPMLLVNRYNGYLDGVDLDEVDLVVFPESAVVNGGWIENLDNHTVPNPLDSLCTGKEVFFGSHLFSIAKGDEREHYSARTLDDVGTKYLSHNCIVFRDSKGKYTIRSKEKYIPFHESIPYPNFFSFAREWYNKDAIPTFLTRYRLSHDESFKTSQGLAISPLMCFESTFTDMALRNNDADFILVLANESWNDQMRGKEQYITYLRAKAIESGKTILKVSNGGITGMINRKGELEYQLGFDKPLIQVIDVKIDKDHSIYSAIGYPFSRAICILVITLFVFALYKQRQAKN